MKRFSDYLLEECAAVEKKQQVLKEDMGITLMVLTGVASAAAGAYITNRLRNYITKYKRCNSIVSKDIRFKCESEILKSHIAEMNNVLNSCKTFYKDDEEKKQRCLSEVRKKIERLEKKKSKYKLKSNLHKLDRNIEEDK